jgi:hypothetical protein
MGYSDQRYYAEDKITIGLGELATATVSGVNTLVGVLRPPIFARRKKLLRFRVEVVASPTAGSTGHLFALRNGTATVAVATLGTGTNTNVGAGVWANIAGQPVGQIELSEIVTTATLPSGQTIVTRNSNPLADSAEGTELTVAIIATATVSGQNLGVYDSFMLTRDNPS